MADDQPQSGNESLQNQQKQSLSPEQREAEGRALCRDLDPFHTLRSALTQFGFERNEYAGIPVPLNGIEVVIDPSYPHAKAWKEINRMTMGREEGPPKPHWTDNYEVVNTFYSHKKRSDIIVIRNRRTSMVEYRLRPAAHSSSQIMATLYASDVWGVDQEQAALQTLGGMLKHRQFKQYLLTGMFLESSSRSGIPYLFRRLRPTIALNAIRRGEEDSEKEAEILCALCMHPIAYYAGSWAGAMTPTDDVIAHLALMRGDEHMFWKRCSQHPAWRPEAGL